MTKSFMIRSKRRAAPIHPQNSGSTAGGVDLGPTPERRGHGPIERLERTIGDSAGRPGRPYRVVDTLAAMERRGSITTGMRQAGEDFRARFKTAQLDPLKAFDVSRPMAGRNTARPFSEEPGLRIESAREVCGTQYSQWEVLGRPEARAYGMC